MTLENRLEILRQHIEFLAIFDPAGLKKIPHIRVVQPAGERPKGEDCYDFVFGEEGLDAAIARLRVTGIQVASEVGAIAFYFNDGKLRHAGIVSDSDGSVISKWGPDSHVYEHPAHFIPQSYGKIGGYYFDPLRPKKN